MESEAVSGMAAPCNANAEILGSMRKTLSLRNVPMFGNLQSYNYLMPDC